MQELLDKLSPEGRQTLLDKLISGDIVLNEEKRKPTMLKNLTDRVVGNFGTTVIGVYTHYDDIMLGFTSMSYPLIFKGFLSVIVFSLSKDPKEIISSETATLLITILLLLR